MPRQSDDPENPTTLPHPELNPLLNPTLGMNMGRWAEVYFNSPPEKRDEAVQELLHELESQAHAARPSASSSSSTESSGSENAGAMPRTHITAAAGATPNTVDETHGVTCFWCGYVNRPQYKFCGRCGETLAGAEVHDTSQGENGTASQPNAEASSPVPFLPSLEPAAEFPRRKIPSFRPLENLPTLHLGLESSSRSFRPWFAAVLAAILVALIYVAWRGAASKPQTSSTSTTQSGPPHSFAEPDTNAPPNRYPETPPTPAKTGGTEPVTPNHVAPANAATANWQAGTASANAAASPGETGATPVPSGKGFEELAVARDLLDGTHGKPRDPAQASELLWKAVRKENVEATVLLSDLYLRGDGVGKSCEQAHLLLDAAAAKGRKDAAERLQNLSAFGCQ